MLAERNLLGGSDTDWCSTGLVLGSRGKKSAGLLFRLWPPNHKPQKIKATLFRPFFRAVFLARKSIIPANLNLENLRHRNRFRPRCGVCFYTSLTARCGGASLGQSSRSITVSSFSFFFPFACWRAVLLRCCVPSGVAGQGAATERPFKKRKNEGQGEDLCKSYFTQRSGGHVKYLPHANLEEKKARALLRDGNENSLSDATPD